MTTITYTLHPFTVAELAKIPKNTVAEQSAKRGVMRAEPILLGLDGMLRFAHAYVSKHGSPIADDYVARPEFIGALRGIHGLLNFDGAVAMERGYNTDSKDNGVCEAIYWEALRVAGLCEAELD